MTTSVVYRDRAWHRPKARPSPSPSTSAGRCGLASFWGSRRPAFFGGLWEAFALGAVAAAARARTRRGPRRRAARGRVFSPAAPPAGAGRGTHGRPALLLVVSPVVGQLRLRLPEQSVPMEGGVR